MVKAEHINNENLIMSHNLSLNISSQNEGTKSKPLTYQPPSLKSDLNSEDFGFFTGIKEVKLPDEYSFKNIEETEQAKKNLLDEYGAFPSNIRDGK